MRFGICIDYSRSNVKLDYNHLILNRNPVYKLLSTVNSFQVFVNIKWRPVFAHCSFVCTYFNFNAVITCLFHDACLFCKFINLIRRNYLDISFIISEFKKASQIGSSSPSERKPTTCIDFTSCL